MTYPSEINQEKDLINKSNENFIEISEYTPPIIRRNRSGEICEIIFDANRYNDMFSDDVEHTRQEPKHVCMDEDEVYRQKMK